MPNVLLWQHLMSPVYLRKLFLEEAMRNDAKLKIQRGLVHMSPEMFSTVLFMLFDIMNHYHMVYFFT